MNILVIRIADNVSDEVLNEIAKAISGITRNNCSQLNVLTHNDLMLNKDNVTKAFDDIALICGAPANENSFVNNFQRAIATGAIGKEVISLLAEELPKRSELRFSPAYNKILFLINLSSGLMR